MKGTYLSTPFSPSLAEVNVARALTIHLRWTWPIKVAIVDLISIKQAIQGWCSGLLWGYPAAACPKAR
jgi:hypothetical protein